MSYIYFQGNAMGIHYDYKSTRGAKAMEKAAIFNTYLIELFKNHKLMKIFQNEDYEKDLEMALRPSKATFYSAVLPGLGQAYNKKYWKIPIVYGALVDFGLLFIENS